MFCLQAAPKELQHCEQQVQDSSTGSPAQSALKLWTKSSTQKMSSILPLRSVPWIQKNFRFVSCENSCGTVPPSKSKKRTVQRKKKLNGSCFRQARYIPNLPFPYSNSSLKFVRLASSVGRVPWILFFSKYNDSSLVVLPISVGIVPWISLPSKSR